MKQAIFTALFTAGCVVSSAYAITPQVGDIKDNRTTGQFFAGLELEVNLVGDDAADAESARVTITEASDSTGRSILKSDTKAEFEEFSSFGGAKTVKLSLANPARKAETLAKVAGSIELYVPKRDPQASVKVPSVLTGTGKPIGNPALKAAGIEMTVLSKSDLEKRQAEEKKKMEEEAKKAGIAGAMAMGFANAFGGFGSENAISYEIKDPQKKLVKFRLVSPSGEEIRRTSWSMGGEMQTVDYAEKVPADAVLEVLVLTDKALVKTPLKLENVPLP